MLRGTGSFSTTGKGYANNDRMARIDLRAKERTQRFMIGVRRWIEWLGKEVFV